MNERKITMKKLIMFAAMLAAVGMVAGCFTSATAYTEKTNPDGTKTVSRVSVIGTGDKASQVAAEGLFADGAADDLGAGVKTASANQKSTGIDGTLKGVGDLLGGIAAVMRAYPAVPSAAAGAAQTSAVDGGYTFAAATTYDTAPTEYNGVPGENGIGVYGRSGCGRCAAYAAAHPDIAMIDIGNEQYRKTMWDTLKGRFKFTGTNVNLPVVITADGFTQAAK
jgi:hypothetical protein